MKHYNLSKNKRLANLILTLIIINKYKNKNKNIDIKKMYKYLIHWIYYGKYNKYILNLYDSNNDKKIPFWYSGFNYDKSLKKELNLLKKQFSFKSDWETFLISSLYKTKQNRYIYSYIKKKYNKKHLHNFENIHSKAYTYSSLNRIKKLKENINIFFNIDKKHYKNSYLLNSEFNIISKFSNNNRIPIHIYSKKGCNDIIKYIKKKYKNLYLKCIDCKNLKINNCYKKNNNTFLKKKKI